jgi:hypothetical protein
VADVEVLVFDPRTKPGRPLVHVRHTAAGAPSSQGGRSILIGGVLPFVPITNPSFAHPVYRGVRVFGQPTPSSVPGRSRREPSEGTGHRLSVDEHGVVRRDRSDKLRPVRASKRHPLLAARHGCG